MNQHVFARPSLALLALAAVAVALHAQPPARPLTARTLLASDAVADDQFGSAVALGDGVALIGAPSANAGGLRDAGRAYVWSRDHRGVWRETAPLTASDADRDDQLGDALALSGSRALIGAPCADAPLRDDTGAAYVFEQGPAGAWQEVAKLEASDQGIADRFGRGVALEGDRALIGAALDDTDGAADAGSAYVFERDISGTWRQVAKLQAADPSANDQFGDAVALSGDRALIGARLRDTPAGDDAGLVYVFERNASGTWIEVATIAPPDAMRVDHFGTALALIGDRAVIGAPLANTSRGSNAGVAYVFERDGTGAWPTVRRLEANNGTTADQFGAAVALSGERILVGARFHDVTSISGSAYLFERDRAGSWWQLARVTAEEPAGLDRFGGAVALYGADALVGAHCADLAATDAGTATVFDVRGTKLQASDRAATDAFGAAVALQGGRAVFGAPGVDLGGTNDSGAAYVFERESGGAWREAMKLIATDPGVADRFGSAVAVDGDWILVGSPFDDVAQGNDAGAAYLFERDRSGVWAQRQQLLPDAPAADDEFGRAVALQGRRALVGAPRDDHGRGTNAGSAYVFEPDRDGVWRQVAFLAAADGAAHDWFGAAVALDQDRALIGAPQQAVWTGAAYVFERDSRGIWHQVDKLTASDGARQDCFGDAVALWGIRAAIGAPLHALDGAVYAYHRVGGTLWSEQKLVDSRVVGPGNFGAAVALFGDRLLVGKPRGLPASGLGRGLAVLFTQDAGGPWQLRRRWSMTDAAAFDDIGRAVALSGDNLLMSSPRKGPVGLSGAGAAYVAPLPPLATCTVRNGSGTNPADFRCVTAPALGTDWNTSVATSPSTALTAVGLAALPAQLPLPGTGGELLLGTTPQPVFSVGLGPHSMTIPLETSLLGAPLYSQGFRIDAPSGSGALVPLNGIDLVLGV
ncbi:MAG: hypothetical protein AAF628_13615 [Planctomycetota bacterium]